MASNSLKIITNAISPISPTIFLLFLQLLVAPPGLRGGHLKNRGAWGAVVPALIVFGDSIVDPGNNDQLLTVVKSNFPPYGRDFPGGQPTGRFSNGKITPDFIASSLGLKGLLPAYYGTNLGAHDLLTGVSFASAGTGFDPFTSTAVLVIPMSQQLDLFREYIEKLRSIVGEKKAASIIAGSLYIVCAGSNDVVQYFNNPFRHLAENIQDYSEFLAQSASSFLQELLNLGARKIGVAGIPPVGCVPSQRTLAGGLFRECVGDRNELAQTYNADLNKELERLATKYNGAKLVYIDIYSSLLDLIQNPENYGFQESTKGCCGTGTVEVGPLCNGLSHTCTNASEYVFWDSYHPTERAAKVLVDEIIKKYGSELL